MRGDVRCVDMYKLQLLDPPNDTKTIAKARIHGRKGVYLPTLMYHTNEPFNVGNYISPMTHGSEIGLEIGFWETFLRQVFSNMSDDIPRGTRETVPSQLDRRMRRSRSRLRDGSALSFFRPFETPRTIDSARMTRWWFQTFFIFTPILGEMIQFD